jgi:endonuclease-3
MRCAGGRVIELKLVEQFTKYVNLKTRHVILKESQPVKSVQIVEFFKTLQAANPYPKTELNYRSHFELLVAVLLSAQATDVSVNKATAGLFAVANTPQAILALGQAGVEHWIKSIGLYRSKAKHLLQTCDLLVNQYNGEVPADREALQNLPGVGRKTANVVLNTAFGQLTMAVDTHIFRVSNRTGLAKGTTPLAVEMKLLKRVPKEFLLHAHHWLILHGRYVCIARQPQCGRCSVAAYCDFKPKQMINS